MLRFIPLGGFLGAGKTTTMLAAARSLEKRGERVSLVTNDQGGDLVDSALARAAALGEVAEVTGGCFCCRFDDLASVITRLTEDVRPSVVLAEAVGSCTDLQSTVVRPLRHFYGDDLRVAPLTVLADPIRYAGMSRLWERLDSEPDLAYLFRHQLDEADVIAINKIDLIGAQDAARLRDDIQRRFPHAHVVSCSAVTGEGLEELLALWTGPPGEEHAHTPFAVDYERYGAAEAELAWTNQTWSVRAADSFAPAEWVREFLRTFGASAVHQDIVIGHVKVRVSSTDGTTKASLTEAGAAPSYDEQHWIGTPEADVVLNARVRTSPEQLDELIAASTGAADAAVSAVSGRRRGDIFRPGFPVPVHRM